MGFKSITATRAKVFWLIVAATLGIGCAPGDRDRLPYQNSKLSIEKRVEDLLGRMTTQEKREFLKSSAQATTQAIWRLAIPAIKPFDLSHDTEVPTATAMAATWDPDLVAREARVVAAEALALNRRQVIGPDVREFGEDPWLASRMAVAWVSALQGDGVIATLTGFGRGYGISDDRTLNEKSFPPYEAAIEEAGLWAIQPAVDDPGLIAGILENGWGFKGFVMGGVIARDLDEQVRRRLRAMFGIGIFDVENQPQAAPPESFVESVVLLKNDRDLLPLSSSVRSIAVIGAQSLAIPPDSHTLVNYASGGRIPEAVELARKSEVALLFGGSSALIESIENVNPKTIVVLDRPERVDGVPAILVSWGRHDVGPVIFGRVNPSGKLPVTGPETMFAFGAGLSYTTFRYSDLQIFPRTPRYGQLVQAVLKVTNTGTRSGAEVVGLYVNQKLKAFRRVDLKPGESRTVSFELDRRAMSFYDPLVKTWATEPGVFEVLAGSSPRDIRLRGTFELFR